MDLDPTGTQCFGAGVSSGRLQALKLGQQNKTDGYNKRSAKKGGLEITVSQLDAKSGFRSRSWEKDNTVSVPVTLLFGFCM